MQDAALLQGNWSLLHDIVQTAMMIHKKTFTEVSTQEEQYNCNFSLAAPFSTRGAYSTTSMTDSASLNKDESRLLSDSYRDCVLPRHCSAVGNNGSCCHPAVGRPHALHCMGHHTPYLHTAWLWLGIIAQPVQSAVSQLHSIAGTALPCCHPSTTTSSIIEYS
jgi:hypothetical protein